MGVLPNKPKEGKENLIAKSSRGVRTSSGFVSGHERKEVTIEKSVRQTEIPKAGRINKWGWLTLSVRKG